MGKILFVFGEAQAISACDCFEPPRKRIGVNILIYICGMDDLCQSQKSRLFETVFENDRLKGAASIRGMTKFYSRRVEGNRAGFFDNMFDLAGGGEQEFRFVINEAGDEPWTGNAVHMYMRAGNPFH